MIIKELMTYDTWSEFKSELQRRSGIVLLNRLWLEIKPADPLPWYEVHMKEALNRLSGRMEKLKRCPRCGGNLIFDRDFDGYYKRCVQCSFEIELAPPEGTFLSQVKERRKNIKMILESKLPARV
jgi:hypothetical protein